MAEAVESTTSTTTETKAEETTKAATETEAKEGDAGEAKASEKSLVGGAVGSDDGDKGAAGDDPGKSGDDDKAAAVPEKYEFVLPQGVVLEEGVIEMLEPVFKNAKLSQEAAQSMIDVHMKVRQREVDAHVKQVNDWQTEVKSDKELGGDKFESAMKGVHATVKRLLDPEGAQKLFGYLDDTGLGNHPELVRFIHRVRMAIGEDDTRGTSSTASAEKKTFADKLFGDDPSKPSSTVLGTGGT